MRRARDICLGARYGVDQLEAKPGELEVIGDDCEVAMPSVEASADAREVSSRRAYATTVREVPACPAEFVRAREARVKSRASLRFLESVSRCVDSACVCAGGETSGGNLGQPRGETGRSEVKSKRAVKKTRRRIRIAERNAAIRARQSTGIDALSKHNVSSDADMDWQRENYAFQDNTIFGQNLRPCSNPAVSEGVVSGTTAFVQSMAVAVAGKPVAKGKLSSPLVPPSAGSKLVVPELTGQSFFDFSRLEVSEIVFEQRAILNFAQWYKLNPLEVVFSAVENSSAGVHGWATTTVFDQPAVCAAESGSGSPLTAEDARCPGATKFQDVKGHPGEAKLRRSEAEEIVEDLEKEEKRPGIALFSVSRVV